MASFTSLADISPPSLVSNYPINKDSVSKFTLFIFPYWMHILVSTKYYCMKEIRMKTSFHRSTAAAALRNPGQIAGTGNH
jgi:hypothetical protein